MKATIVRSAKRLFECSLEQTDELVNATALARHIKGREKHLVVGDKIQLEKQNDAYVITDVEDRKNEVFRTTIRDKKKKVIASNLDALVIVTAVSEPLFKRRLIDRYAMRAQQWNIPAILVFNKMDQYSSQSGVDLLYECQRLKQVLVDCYEVSSTQVHTEAKFLKKGLSELKEDLAHKTTIFLGQSGVGKSKLISALTGGEIELMSGELGKVGKGAHTTSWAQLIQSKNYKLIDSPGIRSFAVDDLPPEDLLELFPDLEPLTLQCQFNDCQHQLNSKGCAFHQLDPNTREDSMLLDRLESYRKMLEESSSIPHWRRN